MALRFADRMTGARPVIDPAFHEALRQHFTDDQILDLGMTITFASGWQRFIEAFGVVPDRWRDGAPPPFRAPRPSPGGGPVAPPPATCEGPARETAVARRHASDPARRRTPR